MAKAACPRGVALAPKGAFPVSALTPGAPLGFLGQKQVVPGAESPPEERRERLWVHAAGRLPRPHRRRHPGGLCCCEYPGDAGGGGPPRLGMRCWMEQDGKPETRIISVKTQCVMDRERPCFPAEAHWSILVGCPSGPPLSWRCTAPTVPPELSISTTTGSLAAGSRPFRGA